MSAANYQAELDTLRTQGANGPSAARRLMTLGATESEARQVVADYLATNRREALARQPEQDRALLAMVDDGRIRVGSPAAGFPMFVDGERMQYLMHESLRRLGKRGLFTSLGYDGHTWDGRYILTDAGRSVLTSRDS